MENGAALVRMDLTNSKLRGKKLKKIVSLICSYLFTLLCLIYLSSFINFTEMLDIFLNLDLYLVFCSLLSLALGYFVRIWRWKFMLSQISSNVLITSCAAPFLGSIALNNLFPLRAGDFVRAFVFPSSIGVSKHNSVLTLLLERLVDLVVLVTIFFVCFLSFDLINSDSIRHMLPYLKYLLSFSLFFTLLVMLIYILSKNRNQNIYIYKTKAYLKTIKEDLKIFAKGSTFPKLLMMSLLVWAFEAGVFYFAILNFKFEPTFLIALFVMSAATLATLIPSAPGYFGSFHLAIFFAFSILWQEVGSIASFAIYVHFLIWGGTSIAGLCAILLRPDLFNLSSDRRLE